jgi:hypothetical protein
VADSNLELAATDDLVAELFRRHEAALVMLGRMAEDRGDMDEVKIYRKGGVVAALGMAEYAKACVTQKILKAYRED